MNDWELEKYKRMSEFTLDEYKMLEKTGMMYEFYPWATGQWLKDKEHAKHMYELKRGK